MLAKLGAATAFDNHAGCRYFLSVPENNRLSAVRFGADGLVPVVTQESRSGDILTLAYANHDALDRTLSTGLAHYFSRSRGILWQKGETSGHVQRVTEIRLDCDGDAVLYYTAQLLADGHKKISQKVGEEAVEVVAAAHSEDNERLAEEAADLLYHLLVLLQARGVPLNAIWRNLETREAKREK
jgi:phosphoribosyl-ATP pyrophosphohydrolase/phosphoribosyl-AMP cyclohydrolase